MSLVINTRYCDRCGTCIAVCPQNALMLTNELSVNNETCTRCGVCVSLCPIAALTIEK